MTRFQQHTSGELADRLADLCKRQVVLDAPTADLLAECAKRLRAAQPLRVAEAATELEVERFMDAARAVATERQCDDRGHLLGAKFSREALQRLFHEMRRVEFHVAPSAGRITDLIAEIRATKTMARRDFLFDQIIGVWEEAVPPPSTPSGQV